MKEREIPGGRGVKGMGETEEEEGWRKWMYW